jgi:hypothetical protein
MHRIAPVLAMAIFLAAVAQPAEARRKVVVRHGPYRTKVVVVHGHPIHRPLPAVVVRPARGGAFYSPRPVFLTPVDWRGDVIHRPARGRLIWEDSELIRREEGWVDVSLRVNRRGSALYFKLDGQAKINFAEVVFANGETQVVDFKEKTRRSGIYRLLDFRDNRRVSHVRMIARARSDETRITILLDR